MGLPKPDLIIFLDIDSKTAMDRGGFGNERYEREQVQQRVRQLFHDVIAMEEKGEKVSTIIDAAQNVEEVSTAVQQAAESILKSQRLERPLGIIET